MPTAPSLLNHTTPDTPFPGGRAYKQIAVVRCIPHPAHPCKVHREEQGPGQEHFYSVLTGERLEYRIGRMLRSRVTYDGVGLYVCASERDARRAWFRSDSELLMEQRVLLEVEVPVGTPYRLHQSGGAPVYAVGRLTPVRVIERLPG